MSSIEIHQPGPLYKNPIYPKSFPDPFVLKHNGTYYAYCTERWDDGRVFGVLRSDDLIDWTPVGGAMAELDPHQPFYWAPEVTYWNGTFYLYYSTGNETLMHLRVATSDRPDGGFVDAGVRLTSEDFAIDAHVFIDDDGQRYMFYATDFLEHSHVGTGVVMDRMTDWFTLAGEPRPVVRAKYDWQVYDPARKEKGGVRWHTVEGPFVLKRKGRYYMMFSGGNWQQPTYGVSFAAAGDLNSANEWLQFCDGERIMPILRTDEQHQVGPGHNSVVRGPDNRDLYCVYHYWHEGNRVLAANRMDFAGPRIFIENKPYLPKTAPLAPSAKFALAADVGWESAGSWEIRGGAAVTPAGELSLLRSRPLPTSFLCEVSLTVAEISEGGLAGFRLETNEGESCGLVLCLRKGRLSYEWIESGNVEVGSPMTLGTEFRADAAHLISIEADEGQLCFKLDGTYLTSSPKLARPPEHLSLFAEGAKAVFSGLAVTPGFEDRFDSEIDENADTVPGWHRSLDSSELTVRDRELIFSQPDEPESVLWKGEFAEEFDFAVNIRQKGPPVPGSSYGFVLLGEANERLARFEFRENDGRFHLSNEGGPPLELPFDFNPRVLYQFRFRLRSGELYLDLETVPLGAVPVKAGKARLGIFACRASVALDMARLTIINS